MILGWILISNEANDEDDDDEDVDDQEQPDYVLIVRWVKERLSPEEGKRPNTSA